MQLFRTTAFCASAILISAQANVEAAERRAAMPEAYREVFATYCYDCHGNGAAEGKVDLEHLTFEVSQDIPTAELWQKVLNAINSGEMPPQESDPIADSAKADFLEALSNEMVTARQILSDTGGTITLRRLNRREYANTLERLIGVRPDVSDLPDDQAGGGYDTIGSGLFVSGDQLEAYLATAERALRVALSISESRTSRVTRIEAETDAWPKYEDRAAEIRERARLAVALNSQSTRPPSDFGFDDAGDARKALSYEDQYLPQLEDYLSRSENQHGSSLISTIKQGITKFRTRVFDEHSPGDYILRVRAGRYAGVERRYHYIEVTRAAPDSKATERVAWRYVPGTVGNPSVVEIPITHRAGERYVYSIHQRTHQGRGDKNLWAIARQEDPVGTPPGLWVDWIEVEGPVPPTSALNPSAETNLSGVELPVAGSENEAAQAAAALKTFACAAYRGQDPADEQLDRLVSIYSSERDKGRLPSEAIIRPLSIVLSSPSFLYLVEGDGDNGRALTGYELASRLSYFLWSEPPDAELLALAEDGRLGEPSVLGEQTARLLRDERSDRFVASFLHQWLDMERLGLFEYSARLYPKFDNAVRASARQEVYETFRAVLDEHLPLNTLLRADFVVINDVLGDYYGIEGADGHEFRSVAVPEGSPRGGLLGTAAVLAMGSDGTKTSPVERGAWVLRHLLNNPPPPAPANVPQLSRLEGQKLSARDLQAAHQEQPQCANCHRKIDPIGYGLENFDASGQWRDVERQPTRVRFNARPKYDEFPIEPAGMLFTGESFDGYASLRDVIAGHDVRFARGMVEELIAYGLGRPYGFTDLELADEILSASGHDGERTIDAVIHALVQSESFRSK